LDETKKSKDVVIRYSNWKNKANLVIATTDGYTFEGSFADLISVS
jgi:hypothetical protein